MAWGVWGGSFHLSSAWSQHDSPSHSQKQVRIPAEDIKMTSQEPFRSPSLEWPRGLGKKHLAGKSALLSNGESGSGMKQSLTAPWGHNSPQIPRDKSFHTKVLGLSKAAWLQSRLTALVPAYLLDSISIQVVDHHPEFFGDFQRVLQLAPVIRSLHWHQSLQRKKNKSLQGRASGKCTIQGQQTAKGSFSMPLNQTFQRPKIKNKKGWGERWQAVSVNGVVYA